MLQSNMSDTFPDPPLRWKSPATKLAGGLYASGIQCPTTASAPVNNCVDKGSGACGRRRVFHGITGVVFHAENRLSAMLEVHAAAGGKCTMRDVAADRTAWL
jgi:hypothetical protein